MRKILFFIAFMICIFMCFNVYADRLHDISVEFQIGSFNAVVNEDITKIDSDDLIVLYVENGRTLVPLRFIAECLELNVKWDDSSKTVTLTNDNTEILIYIGKTEAYVNGVLFQLDCCAEINNQRTFVPVRFLSEALKCSVEWESETEKIYVKRKNTDAYILLRAEDQLNTTETKIEKIINNMTLSDMVYQMMFVAPESVPNNNFSLYPVGGIVYFADDLKNRSQTINMINSAQSSSEIPLFISVDEEGGIVSRLGQNSAMGTTKLPAMKTIGDSGDVNRAYNGGATLAKDLKSLGFNMDFAPVADVLINTSNSEIGSRSFGTNPENVSRMVENVVKGMQNNGLSATLKHFPGHGSTYKNSHYGYSESARTLNQLRTNEFLPFSAGINAGVDFIMVSHMTLINATQEKVPCSVSKEVINDMLINELGYKNIIITDSFSMGAITDKYTPGQAVVKSVSAGADMILMTPDLKAAHDALVNAIDRGEISRERIENSVRKIISVKIKMGLI